MARDILPNSWGEKRRRTKNDESYERAVWVYWPKGKINQMLREFRLSDIRDTIPLYDETPVA